MEENTEDASVAKTYIFKQLNREVGRIKLAKELVVTSGTVKEVVTENTPYQGAKVGEKYIELLIANQEQPLYIPANDLVEYITTEDTTTIDLTLDADHKLTAELKDNAVGTAKIADKAVTVAKLEEAIQTKLGYVDVNKNVTVAIADAVKGLAGGEGVTATVKGNAEAIENITKNGGTIDTKIDAKIAAEALGTMAKETAADYVKKADAVGYNDILTKTAAEGIYAKTADLGDLAGVDKITNADVADNAAIAVSKIDGLGALATKGEIKNADVAADAAIAVTKIAGLGTAATANVVDIQNGVIGTAGDAKEANTVYGAKAFATDLDTKTNKKYDDIVDQINEFHEDVTEALNKKVDAGTIAHTTDGVAEGVTRNGTTLNIVVDAYKKAETYNTTELESKLYEGSYVNAEGQSVTSNITANKDKARLISTEEIKKLAGLSFAEDGSVGISGTVEASKVTGLDSHIDGRVTGANGLNIAAGAQVNVIEAVKVDGTALKIENKAVNIVLPKKLSEFEDDLAHVTTVKVKDT
jgi:hypothetical protein